MPGRTRYDYDVRIGEAERDAATAQLREHFVAGRLTFDELTERIDAALTAKTIIYVKGSGSWDKAFDIISGSFKKIKTYLDKEGIKTDCLPMTIFTATDDTGFDYQAAVPIAEAPKNPPHGDIAIGQSPEGQALKFVHRGSYDDLDNTYEAITNYLDDKRLEAKDMFIEEYVTDPATADANKLVVNVYVIIKPPGTSPG